MIRSMQAVGRAVAVAVAGASLWSLPAFAETQISIFGGANWNFGSDIKVTGRADPKQNTERSVDWDGGFDVLPPYWGVRGTYWLSKASPWGFAIDYAHTKAIADDSLHDQFSRLEFTDGNNLLLLDALYRFAPMMNGALVPYVGAGIGVTVPHVEVTFKDDPGPRTFEYQCCGPAAQILAGLEYKLDNTWSLFTEARLSYSHIDADLRGGGSLETDIWSPQLAIGVTYRFSSF